MDDPGAVRASPEDAAVQPSAAVEAGIPARKVIFWLFVALAIATAASLLLFAPMVEAGPSRDRVYIALIGDLMLPVVAWFILIWIGKRRKADRKTP